LVDEKEISIPYIPTNEQAADILTKPLQKEKHGQMQNLLGLKYFISVLLTMCSLCLFGLTTGITTQSIAPVIWRKHDIPVTNGYHQVHMLIRLICPCDMLSNETIHTDIVQEAKEACNRIYEDSFLKSIETMCPNHRFSHRIQKRFISLVIGAIILINVNVVGMSASGMVLGAITLLSSMNMHYDLMSWNKISLLPQNSKKL